MKKIIFLSSFLVLVGNYSLSVHAEIYEPELNGLRNRQRAYQEVAEKKLDALYRYRMQRQEMSERLSKISSILKNTGRVKSVQKNTDHSLSLWQEELNTSLHEKAKAEQALNELEYFRLVLPFHFAPIKKSLQEFPDLDASVMEEKHILMESVLSLEKHLLQMKEQAEENIEKWQQSQLHFFAFHENLYRDQVKAQLQYQENFLRFQRNLRLAKTRFFLAVKREDYQKAKNYLQGLSWLLAHADHYFVPLLINQERLRDYTTFIKSAKEDESDMMEMTKVILQQQQDQQELQIGQAGNKIWNFEIPWERAQTAERKRREHENRERRLMEKRKQTKPPANEYFRPGPHKYAFEYEYTDSRGRTIKVKTEGQADSRTHYNKLVKEFSKAVVVKREAVGPENRVVNPAPMRDFKGPSEGYTVLRNDLTVTVVSLAQGNNFKDNIDIELRSKVQKGLRLKGHFAKQPLLQKILEQLEQEIQSAVNLVTHEKERGELVALTDEIARFKSLHKFYQHEFDAELKQILATKKFHQGLFTQFDQYKKSKMVPLQIPQDLQDPQGSEGVAALSMELASKNIDKGKVEMGDFFAALVINQVLERNPLDQSTSMLSGVEVMIPGLFSEAAAASKMRLVLERMFVFNANEELNSIFVRNIKRILGDLPGFFEQVATELGPEQVANFMAGYGECSEEVKKLMKKKYRGNRESFFEVWNRFRNERRERSFFQDFE